MGLFDSATNTFGNNSPRGLEASTRLIQATLALIADNGQGGGLRGLMERFQEAGLGNTISSWIGSGPNVPITEEQIQQALGDGWLQQIAEEAGLTQDDAARQLSELLPTMVDKLTPADHIPQGGLGSMSTLLEHFLRVS